MEKMINYMRFLPVVIIVVVSFFVAFINFYGNYSILGNDLNVSGLFWMDLLNNHFYIWGSYINVGAFTVINLLQIFNVLFNIIINTSTWLGLFIFLIITNGLFFILLKEFYVDIYKKKSEQLLIKEIILLVISSLSFIYNFFTLSVYSQPASSYILFLFFFPLIILLLYRYLKKPTLSRMILFSIATTVGLVINLAHFLLIIFSAFIFSLFFARKYDLRLINNGLASIFLFLLLSLYFFLPSLLVGDNPYLGYGNIDSNNVTATVSFSSRYTSILNLFQMREIAWFSNYKYIYDKIGGIYLYLLAIFPVIALLSLTKKSFNKKEKKGKIAFLILFLIGILLTKGYHVPLVPLNELFYKIPAAAIFRSNYDKFVILITFSFPFLLVISLHSILDKNKMLFGSVVFFLSVLILFPFSQEILNPIYKVNIPADYFYLRDEYAKKKLDSSLLVLPNYYINSYVSTNWYKGSDFYPTLLNKKSINELLLYNLGFFNINKIESLDNYATNQSKIINTNFPEILNSDAIILDKTFRENFDAGSSGGLLNQFGQTKLGIARSILDLSDQYIKSTSESFDVYSLRREYFLPHIYIPKSIIITNQNVDSLPEFVSQKNENISLAIYFQKQNDREIDILNQIYGYNKNTETNPVLEFKKINPTKYRVVLHEVSGQFPLVFSESFHDGWKAYLEKGGLDSRLRGNATLENYKTLDGNADDQANKDELNDYIDKSWVTTLGDNNNKEIKHQKWVDNAEKLDYIEKYNIDFISKNFQGTIQNDNLPSGKFYETWFARGLNSRFLGNGNFFQNKNVVELPETNHLMANGYANSWVIDAEKLCSENKDFCIKNQDGTYDMELVVEFWPQRSFYIGLFISGTTLVLCLSYLGYAGIKSWRKRHGHKMS